MSYMSDREFKAKLKEIQKENEGIERKRKLREERMKIFPKIKLPSTSKIVLFVVFLLCLQIVLYCENAMTTSGNYAALYVLIGAPVSLVPVVLSYYWKSKAENTKDGIVYEKAMLKENTTSVTKTSSSNTSLSNASSDTSNTSKDSSGKESNSWIN